MEAKGHAVGAPVEKLRFLPGREYEVQSTLDQPVPLTAWLIHDRSVE